MTVKVQGPDAPQPALGDPAPRCGLCGRHAVETGVWGVKRAGCHYHRLDLEGGEYLLAGICQRCAAVVGIMGRILRGEEAMPGLSAEELKRDADGGCLGLSILVGAAVDAAFDKGRPKH